MKVHGSPTTPTTLNIGAILAGLALILSLITLPACQAPKDGPSLAPLATQPAPVQSAAPDVKTLQTAVSVVSAPLADAQHQAESLPPAVPQRAPLLVDLGKVGEGFNALAGAVEHLAATVHAQDAARELDAQWHAQVEKQYATATQQAADDAGRATAAEAAAKKWEDEYENQWFAGKFWRTFWTVIISAGILLILALTLNYYTNVFVLPLQHIGQWAVQMVASTLKAGWAIVTGIWNEIAGLFRKPSPLPSVPPTP